MKTQIFETFRPPSSNESIPFLIGGLLEDIQKLIRQEAALIQFNIQEEITLYKKNLKIQALIWSASLLGVFALILSLIYLLYEEAGFTLWQSFGSVGGVLLLMGAVGQLIFFKRTKIKETADETKTKARTRGTEREHPILYS
jgi:hypothetical protein